MQPTKDDPTVVDVVYYGEHTCGYTAHSRPTGSSNLQEEPQQPGLEQIPATSPYYDWIDLRFIIPPSNKKVEKTKRKRVQVRVSSVEDVSQEYDGYSWRKYGQKDILVPSTQGRSLFFSFFFLNYT